ncbi:MULTISPECIES: ImmA/IrrE family metallo-endopeptidase [Halomonas]|uniref:Uncharacterized protein DUF955 n=1 Tax=Halomonas ventosae TaxID=229007 RepID=A0A4R6I7A1_9GAMM|nr:ImmA/IrrE family metallo-endopeptidase [Halomonas ventosae]TDO16635.1 uncharacterized protein DUF955 [Halomonas ventosae]
MSDFQIKIMPIAGADRQAITIEVKGQPVTEHFDEQEQLGAAIIADPMPLAEWFAANWWRLRWEPEKENLTAEQQLDWNLSHRLAAAASGYQWPDLQLSSDDAAIRCVACKTEGRFTTIRFTRQLDEWLNAQGFEEGVDAFINALASRYPGSNLAQLWHELLDERHDPAAIDWRKLEAKAGYDPDEAPEALIEGLQRFYGVFGKDSVEELGSDNRGTTALEHAQRLYRSLQASRHTMSPDLTGFALQAGTALTREYQPVWKQAARAASWVRSKLGISPEEQLTNGRLLDYLGLSKQVWSQASKAQVDTAGLRKGDNQAVVVVHQGRNTAKRFSLARLLGDYVYTQQQVNSQLLSLTHSRTRRQKFQRAFAQELLCPYEGLLEALETAQPGEESLEKIAKHYQVSPLTVNYTLENRQQ